MRKKILAFGTHPDDIEIGCGGSLIKLIENGHHVFSACMTSGESGSREVSSKELGSEREKEALAAAKILGLVDVHFFRYADGMTSYSREMKIEVVNLIRKIQPQVVFVHGSQDRYGDHQCIHQLVIESINAAQGPWFQESKGEPFQVETIFGYEVWQPFPSVSLAVDVSQVMEKKLKALREHKSQVKSVAYDDAVLGLARYRGTMTLTGGYGEVFEVLRASEASCFSQLFHKSGSSTEA